MKSIDAITLIKMFENGCKLISDNCDYINELNVFPVPDGDTGTNMKITSTSALDATKLKLSNNPSVYEIGAVFCRQLLMNARGNSGVIFSQIIRGFFEPIQESDKTLDVDLMIKCFVSGKNKAYKSISNPVEGTILTVIRIVSEHIVNSKYSSIEDLLKNVLKIALDALGQTPEFLPSLKEAKVVDSGGYGLCKFLEGMYTHIAKDKGDIQEDNEIKTAEQKISNISFSSKNTFIQTPDKYDVSEEGFGYCCEFIIQTDFKVSETQSKKIKWNKSEFEKELLSFGDSLVLVHDKEIIKVHMHSFEPYKFLRTGQKYGEFLKIKIDNMTLQFLENHPEITPKDLFKKFKLSDDIKIIATVPSKKVAEYYKNEFNISNTIITEMIGNPSTSDIMNQISAAHSKNIIIITDDSNIILSAEQAVELSGYKINVSVCRGKNLMESFVACMAFNPSLSLKENQKLMDKQIKKVSTGLISSSVKTAKFGSVFVEKNDVIGILDKKIVLAEKKSEFAIISLINKLKQKVKKPSIVYLIYGEGIPIREVRNIEKYVNENFGIKCKIIEGKQKLYQYYVGMQ
ncbi:MAG: DAK2 domain-containing protein [Malacoplasma sp.]|nr:DAK2 domain-containing protein [Malacoplasma sp.]